jgi:REP element-mobilizing transposase RayT
MQQLNFIPKSRLDHGGALSENTRRSRRPLATKRPLHITLRSEHATGVRSLLNHQGLIHAVIAKAARRFGVRVYRLAICGNHIHALIRGLTRIGIQNFFRVLAGHIAQGILRKHPLDPKKLSRPIQACKKNQRRFWDLLLFSRVLTWGREFKTVANYILQNTLEALNIIAYKPRKKKTRKPFS